MTLSTTTSRATYSGNGVTVAFSFPYKFLVNADLVVKLQRDSTGAVTAQALTTDYTITGAGLAAGGTVTMVVAPPTGYTLVIYRSNAQTQDLHFVENDPLPVVELEKRLDKLTMIAQRLSDRLDRALVLDDGYAPAFTNTLPTLLTAGASLIFNPSANGWILGPTADAITNAQGYATTASRWATYTAGTVVDAVSLADSGDYSAKNYAIGTLAGVGGSAKDWAQKTSAAVTGSSYSSKEWAVGTQTRGVASSGSAKDWATYTSSTVDDAGYSAKEWAVGTQTRGVASSGSAKDWATYVSSTVDNTSYSAKEYAQGTQASTGGSSKSWATQTGSKIQTVDYSSKEWAIGTTGRGAASSGSAKDWATYTGAVVDDTSYSAKEYAQGTTAAVGGSAKDWAQKTSAAVTGSSYSSKEWAVGTQTRGAASGGSSKDWATYTGGLVDDSGYSAKQWATKATTTVDGSNYSSYQYALNSGVSAAAAAASAASIALTTKGDLLTYGSSMTRKGIGSDGQALLGDSSQTTGNQWTTIDGSPSMLNHSLTAAVAASALTIALVGSNGSNASATNPIRISFRSSTAATGTYVARYITAALSTVISSGSTAGHASAIASYLYIYAIDNAGTVELAWSSSIFDEGTRQSTTAEGGAGAATSRTTLYSTTARSNVGIRLIGRFSSTQATAGTWATAIAEISLPPFHSLKSKQPLVTVYTSSSGTHYPTAGYSSMRARLVGGGGSGGATGTGGGSAATGGATTFGALSAGGGVAGGGVSADGGAGGTSSGGNIANIPGGKGMAGGGAGGGAILLAADGGSAGGGMGHCGRGGFYANDGLAGANYGGGGGSAGMTATSQSAGGGGGAGYCEHLYTTLASSYAYSVGAGAAAATAGTGGKASGAGAGGIIIIEEF